MFRFFLKHSFRDVGRHPCHFCLALCSVFIVVLFTLVINTVTAQGPIVFVSLAQVETGEMDVWYTGSWRCRGANEDCPQVMNTYRVGDKYLNFTQV